MILVVAAVTATALLAAPAAREEPDRALDVGMRETVDVTVVHLDAVVTDRDDRPLTDLSPSDFQLRVDGKRVQVKSLTEGRELRETVAGRLTLVVLLDDRHLLPKHRNAVLAELSDALVTEMRDNPTWVAVTAWSEGLDLLLAPSRDVAAVLAALDAASRREPPPSDLRELQRRSTNDVTDLLRNLARSGSSYRLAEAGKGSVFVRLHGYGEALARDTSETVAGIQSLVEALSYVPGRKAVLLVSDGLPRQPLDIVAHTMYDRLAAGSAVFGGDDLVAGQPTLGMNDRNVRPTGSDRVDSLAEQKIAVSQNDDGGALDLQLAVIDLGCCAEKLDRLAAIANTHRVSFYPLKPPVLDAAASGLGERASERGDFSELSDMTSGLEMLARATGGLAFASDHRMADFLTRAREDLSAYYSLGFTPPRSLRDTALREMVLRVRRKKTRIRYRASYVQLSLEETLASRAWGTLVFGWEENVHGLEVGTDVGPARGELFPLELLLSLPIGGLELVPAGEVSSGAFRVVLQARRAGGARLEPRHLTFLVEVPRDDLAAARDQYFAVRTGLELPAGDYEVAIGLWEENTARASFVIRRVHLGEARPGVA